MISRLLICSVRSTSDLRFIGFEEEEEEEVNVFDVDVVVVINEEEDDDGAVINDVVEEFSIVDELTKNFANNLNYYYYKY